MQWETTLIEEKGRNLASLLWQCYWAIKKQAVEAEESQMEVEQFDNSFSPDIEGNKYE